MENKEQRKRFIDIAKGIGILAVVIGHTSVPVVRSIYYWHLPLFFFIGGVNYNIEKYHSKERKIVNTAAVINRLNSFIPTYFKYTFLLILLHNTFSSMGILREEYAAPYGKKDMITRLFRIFTLNGEPLEGTAWFIIPYIWGLFFFGIIVSFTYYIRASGKLQWGFIIISCFALSGFAYFIMCFGFVGERWTDIALFVLPYFAIGGLYRKKDMPEIKSSILKWMVFFLCAVFIYVSSDIFKVWNVLDRRRFDWGILGSFVLAFAGIYVVICFSRFIEKISKLFVVSNILRFIGKHSVDIMILHPTFFKLTDYIYFSLFGTPPGYPLQNYPSSITALKWFQPIYWIVGVLGPILVWWVFNWTEKEIDWFMQKFFVLTEKKRTNEVYVKKK